MAQRKPTKRFLIALTQVTKQRIVVQNNLGDSMTFCFVRSQVLPGPEKKIMLRRPTTSLYKILFLH